jgi:hypothetical protein
MLTNGVGHEASNLLIVTGFDLSNAVEVTPDEVGHAQRW